MPRRWLRRRPRSPSSPRIADPTATHNCWAYRIGSEYRFSDDGEPAGTAGRPILAAIDGQGCDQVVVVVTRWYGGIKLGAGGLVRAYGGCAAECLRAAPNAGRWSRMPSVELRLRLRRQRRGACRAGRVSRRKNSTKHFDADGARLRLRLPARSCVDALKAQPARRHP